MTFTQELAQALRHQRILMKHRPDRLRMRLIIMAVWMLGFGFFFASIYGLQHGRLGTAAWWRSTVPGHMLVSACVTACFFFAFRGFERLAPQHWLDTINSWRDWRAGLFYSGTAMLCSVTGLVIGLAAVDAVWSMPGWYRALARPAFWGEFVAISLLISLVLGLRYRARWKQERLQARVTEAQLRLLQGQIEPHFLFNTLANVQSLIDFDPPRAKLMLERFTDYLRASLGQLRGESTTLAQEFAMLESYLGLMQLRMGERLRMRLVLPPELAGVALPPLLIQPLVENAVHHGLEPKIDGGEITISAQRDAQGLCISVADDGQGLDAPRRRPGNGVALDNIRARLAARWGATATLTLAPRDGGGTLALIRIPHTN
ncbi:sensor histidine kinase [Roseateles sp. LKC17W]|uniref:Sensor histidine kinase n=1 Tax=Pelomonas margarita TaxID=3299031 RepID=A0ABW7FMM0_9BURK